mmetsp:Transcript_1958/g.5794  ORF Transcript_1958/g.5794 Transcript_1958/m.5794 type:complete len:246 (-) Transcript_1958:892-1629(-)
MSYRAAGPPYRLEPRPWLRLSPLPLLLLPLRGMLSSAPSGMLWSMDISEDSWDSSPVRTHALTSLSRAVRGLAGISVSSRSLSLLRRLRGTSLSLLMRRKAPVRVRTPVGVFTAITPPLPAPTKPTWLFAEVPRLRLPLCARLGLPRLEPSPTLPVVAIRSSEEPPNDLALKVPLTCTSLLVLRLFSSGLPPFEEASAVYLGPVFCPLWTELSLEVVVTPPVSAAPGCPTPSGAPPSAIHPAELS